MLGVVDGTNNHRPPLVSLPDFEHDKVQLAEECQAASVFGPQVLLASLSHKEGETAQVGLCASGGLLRTSASSFRKLEMEMSEACHKGFVIFDHGEGKSRVIVHPSWLNNCPPFGSAFQWRFNRIAGNPINTPGIANINPAEEAMLGYHSSVAIPAYKMARGELILQVQEKMNVDRRMSSQDQDLKKDVNGMGLSLNTTTKESQEDFHENTEEIDALLSCGYNDEGDELTSTGHSPSDASSNCNSVSHNYHVGSIIGMKRKLQELKPEEADDADSGPGMAESMPGPESQYHTLLNGESWLSLYKPRASIVRAPAGNFGTKAPARSNDGRVRTKVLARSSAGYVERNTQHPSKSCGTFEEGSQLDSSKRVKIRSMVQELKHVVPGGDGLDTAGMLSKTIEYVKCLQRRLRDWEATRELTG